jgi:drug/metabolite transporter superfamily protein YnfA
MVCGKIKIITMIILLKLFLAHLIGDFLLQPLAWVKAKEEKKLRAWQLYVHACLHGVLVMLVTWDMHFIVWALLMAAVHLIIDAAKVSLQNRRNQRWLFFVDQLAHFISIYLIWLWYENESVSWDFLKNERIILLITLLVFLTSPVSLMVRIFISKWTPDTDSQDDMTSLQSAGKYIGIFERLLVFVFMIANQWQAVGFLLAAKSIFRFGNLQEAKDRKLTEYILIGTLVSFGIAVIAGMGFRYWVHG